MAGAEPDPLGDALAALRRGGVVVYPTETVYGLGADATSDDAVRRVAGLKERDAGKPILVLVSSREMLDAVAGRVPSLAEPLMRRFWPGPLTLVVPAAAGLPRGLTGGGAGIGVRISSHPLARSLVERLGRPLTSTSANPGGAPPATGVPAARAYFGDRVDAYVDGGPAQGGAASTVLDLTGEEPVLVREGAVSSAALVEAGVRFSKKE